ncbi:MAG: TetR/AcrR family transcriptional regulator [Beijerinckiaceae bacterium]|jgi:AcrR family transcriptional regulator|nr:TetR/AcrR family transcriptional regulator [Beijerinckiaceae bacterium]
MPRKPGDRNRDYAETRQAILTRLHARLVAERDRPPSFREIASAAEVSMPTLRHYFGDRDAVIAAVMEHQGALGAPYLADLARADLPFEASILEAVMFLAFGLFEARVSGIHAFGLSEGMQSGPLGEAYLARLLEPTLQALESRLAQHVSRQEMRPANLRVAALQLAAPLVLGALHQAYLGGDRLRPLSREELCEALAGSFIEAFRA